MNKLNLDYQRYDINNNFQMPASLCFEIDTNWKRDIGNVLIVKTLGHTWGHLKAIVWPPVEFLSLFGPNSNLRRLIFVLISCVYFALRVCDSSVILWTSVGSYMLLLLTGCWTNSVLLHKKFKLSLSYEYLL